MIILDPTHPVFPDTSRALTNPPGLLAAGGNLQPDVLTDAYTRGIFPWYSEGEPILWWSPNPRAVLLPQDLHISRGSRRQLRKCSFHLTSNQCFEMVLRACAETRESTGTWINNEIIAAYLRLHELGIAQSVEVWEHKALVGGLYGIKLGNLFCGESMFHYKQNAAKFAFCQTAMHLFNHGYRMIDCQINNAFLDSLGVRDMPRDIFETALAHSRTVNLPWPTAWPTISI